MAVRVIKKSLAGSEDLLLGFGTEIQVRNDKNIEITKINASNIPYDETKSIYEFVNDTTKDITSITKKVDTLADMRAMVELPETVWCSGYHSKNDGAFGSHFYRLKGLKTTETDNSGTIIIVSVGGSDYVYELQFDGAVNVKWFGAVGDGVTDDSPSIQKAFNFASENKHVASADAGDYLCNSSITIKSNFIYKGSHNSIFIQNYNYSISPKNESLFVNESYGSLTEEDTNIHLDGLNIINSASSLKGSFISINQCSDYTITNLRAIKNSQNGTINVSGKNILLSNILIDSLNAGFVNADGIHFEYVEDLVLDNANIRSEDDCLGFAYFEVKNGDSAGRNKPSRNIVVTNCNLASYTANGIRVGNTVLTLAEDDLIHPDARYENVVFSNIVFNKVGPGQSCIEMKDVRTNSNYPNTDIRFSNCVINDTTSTTESIIRILGNAYIAGVKTYEEEGSTRNYDRIFFNGISGVHTNAGQMINAGGVKELFIDGFDIKRTNNADNEIITNLVDKVHISNSSFYNYAYTSNSHTLLFIDSYSVKIDSSEILGNGNGSAAIKILRPKLGNGGELIINGTTLGEQAQGIISGSTILLDKIKLDVDYSSIVGQFRNTGLSAIIDDIGTLSMSTPSVSASTNIVKKNNYIVSLNISFQVSAAIPAGSALFGFPSGMKPANATAIRFSIVDAAGASYILDYSSGAGIRTQTNIPIGSFYYLNLCYSI